MRRARGLLRGGSSINNLMAGDAEKSVLTLSTLGTLNEQERSRRTQDLIVFWLNPYLFTRSLALSVGEVLIELGQALRQRLRNVRPRINRLERGYPLVRALTNVFLRDISTYLVALDVVRGVPAIYTTYLSYDEVAHHAGPDTADALNTLRSLDRQIRRIRNVIAAKAPRAYDLFVLSDHGQSAGATFRQRYGQTLTEFIAAHTVLACECGRGGRANDRPELCCGVGRRIADRRTGGNRSRCDAWRCADHAALYSDALNTNHPP